jgi:hypothetical protein
MWTMKRCYHQSLFPEAKTIQYAVLVWNTPAQIIMDFLAHVNMTSAFPGSKVAQRGFP